MTTIFRQFIWIAAACPALLQAQSFEHHDAIDARVAASLAGSGLVALPVDRRLRLMQCPEPLTIDPPIQFMVAVRCPALGWRIHARLAGEGAASSPASSSASSVATLFVVRRGDPVQIELVARGFSVISAGVAEGDARAGDRLRVRVDPTNPARKNASIIGEVVGAGRVRVAALN